MLGLSPAPNEEGPRLDEPQVGSVAPLILRATGMEAGDRLDIVDAAGITIDRRRKNSLVGHGEPRAAHARRREAFGGDGACVLYRREALTAVAVGAEVFDEDMALWASDADVAWRVRNPTLPDAALMRVELEDRVAAVLSVGKVSAGRSHALEVVCDRGIVRADLISGRISVSWGGSPTQRSRQREWVVPGAPTVPAALGAFVRAIRAGRVAPVSFEDAARTHGLVEAALTSARRGGMPVAPPKLGA